ncbi:DUF1848 family protein [Candidatus Desantisbacteria bacterium]|nr:DUF1848 family protein [Candidatus Desantisbacteria bacterium]
MQKKIVISASRRTDIVDCYPEFFIDKLNEIPSETVHTIVIWTKNPANILVNQVLNKKLKEYRQIYIHLTVTGMGGTELEHGIPESDKIFSILPALIDFVSGPERITWRFDPIIRIIKNGTFFTNFVFFDYLLEKISRLGIKTCRTSWVFPYKKVLNHLEKKRFRLIVPSESEMKEDYQYMNTKLGEKNMSLLICAVSGFPGSSCIDGQLFTRLHPEKLFCSTLRAHGQREFCGCTESFDIGSYGLKCKNGCLYCYANPFIM